MALRSEECRFGGSKEGGDERTQEKEIVDHWMRDVQEQQVGEEPEEEEGWGGGFDDPYDEREEGEEEKAKEILDEGFPEGRQEERTEEVEKEEVKEMPDELQTPGRLRTSPKSFDLKVQNAREQITSPDKALRTPPPLSGSKSSGPSRLLKKITSRGRLWPHACATHHCAPISSTALPSQRVQPRLKRCARETRRRSTLQASWATRRVRTALRKS